MSDCGVPQSNLQHAIREVCLLLERNLAQRLRWEALGEDDLWREIVACILGSRVRFDVAHAAMERMDRSALFSTPSRFSRPDEYGYSVLQALSGTDRCGNTVNLPVGYPFARKRADQIQRAAETLYTNGGTIRHLLVQANGVREARRWLSSKVAGLGPKQSSLFLRNIGYAIRVAVLDVHILTYMNWIGLTAISAKSVRTLREYEILEEIFIEHSCSSGFPPDCFDLAVWIVVRVVKRECTACL